MTVETWLPVVGYEGRYEVSDQGRVRSWLRVLNPPRVLRLAMHPTGYHTVELTNSDGRRRTQRVHRLVTRAFLGPRPVDREVRHLDGVKTNNALTNLAYGTRSENERDKVAHGTHHSTRKTHCPQGHPYDEVNTKIRPQGWRSCRVCASAATQRYRARNRAVA